MCTRSVFFGLTRDPRPYTRELLYIYNVNLKLLMRAVQDCLSNGKPLLIENIEEELDPILDPVLEKRFIRQARGLTLQLNDKEVPVCFDPETLH